MPPRRAVPPSTQQRLLALASIAYVVVLAIWVDAGREPRSWVTGAVAIVLVALSLRRPSAEARAAGWGMAVVVESLSADGASRALESCGALGALACTAAACVAIARIPQEGGLAAVTPPSPALPVVTLAVAWWASIAARFAPSSGSSAGGLGLPAAWSWIAIALSVATLAASTEWTLRRRWLELAVVERANAMRALLLTLVMATTVLGLLGRTHADDLARLAVAAAGAALVSAAVHPDPVKVARATRRVVVLAIAGGSLGLLGASAAEGGGYAFLATLVTAAVMLVIGSVSAGLEAPLRPAEGAWLDAFDRASEESTRPDPDEAVRAVLTALRAPTGLGHPSPELWTFGPTRVAVVDVAGYLHEAEGELPEALVLLAAGEPEATLCAETLDALEVRRPELRPLARWMSARGAMLVTVIASEGDAEGMLVLPRGPRGERMSFEEVVAIKGVANHLARACRDRSTRATMLDRAREAVTRAQDAEVRTERLTHDRVLDASRDSLAAARLARPATVGVYSAASRAALEALERRTALGASIAVMAPSGVDPVPYLARAHLSGARRDAPLVVVDSTSAREHDAARWIDPAVSPLALAHRGMLVLLDGAALPRDVQQLVARACAEKQAPWERPDPIDVELALTGILAPDDLVAQGRLDAALALRLADARSAPVVLPRLRDRPEDLRAIVTDRLAREGLRVIGRPVGIEHSAYARLVDYGFPGEDAELAAIAARLVASCKGDVVRAQDVDALHLVPPATEPRFRKDPLSA